MKRNHLEDLGVDGNIILKCIFKKWNGESWTEYGLAQDRDRWPALVSVVMNLQGSIKCRDFLGWLRIG